MGNSGPLSQSPRWPYQQMGINEEMFLENYEMLPKHTSGFSVLRVNTRVGGGRYAPLGSPWLLLGPHRPPRRVAQAQRASYLLHWEQLRQNLHLLSPFILGIPTQLPFTSQARE